MFGKKLVDLRKKQGLSQEDLARKLYVSRQTISKWELGESSPDINTTKEISKVFNISLDELVDNDIRNILESKITNTERLASMIMKILKVSGVIIILFLIGLLIWKFTSNTYAWFIGNDEINCKIGNDHYHYQIDVEIIKHQSNIFTKFKEVEIEASNKIKQINKIGGNAYLSNIVDLTKFEYTYQLFDAVYGYVESHGGSCNFNE